MPSKEFKADLSWSNVCLGYSFRQLHVDYVATLFNDYASDPETRCFRNRSRGE